jgi:hypothetical protein
VYHLRRAASCESLKDRTFPFQVFQAGPSILSITFPDMILGLNILYSSIIIQNHKGAYSPLWALVLYMSQCISNLSIKIC